MSQEVPKFPAHSKKLDKAFEEAFEVATTMNGGPDEKDLFSPSYGTEKFKEALIEIESRAIREGFRLGLWWAASEPTKKRRPR